MRKLSIIILTILFLIGCKATELQERIMEWQTKHPNRKGDCMIYALKASYRYEMKGVPNRLCYGYFKDIPHAWCEYYDPNTNEWLVDDNAIWYVNKGYPREAYTSGNKPDYTIIRIRSARWHTTQSQ